MGRGHVVNQIGARPHGQVEKEKTQVSQAILDVIPKNPEVKHIKKHMKPAPVQKDGAY
jgi:hypothetical protein